MTCGTCNVENGHAEGCPEAGPPPLTWKADGTPETPMSKEERETFGALLRAKINTRRQYHVIDRWNFEPNGVDWANKKLTTTAGPRVPSAIEDRTRAHLEKLDPKNVEQKTVTTAALKLLLDYCENDWPMGFVEYCAAVFHGRLPNPDETAFDLLPDATKRVDADRLGLGHIYQKP